MSLPKTILILHKTSLLAPPPLWFRSCSCRLS